jgi:hypothetical protein
MAFGVRSFFVRDLIAWDSDSLIIQTPVVLKCSRGEICLGIPTNGLPHNRKFRILHDRPDNELDEASVSGGPFGHFSFRHLGFATYSYSMFGFGYMTVFCPCLAIVVVAAPLPIYRILRLWRTVPGHCRKCGYDLRATPDRCPECGTIPPSKKEIAAT